MGSDNWYKVDNVAKVFLATVGKRDTRTLRVSCTLKEKVDPEVLERAVLSAIQDRPQMQVRFRRGLFWHYMEDTDILPKVTEENDRLCPNLYAPAKAMLHYKVTYFANRINLELFHALSDGTGALEFLNIIVLDYLKLKYPGQFDDITVHSGASADDLNQDSFRQFFENKTLSGGTYKKKAYEPGAIKLPHNQLQFFEIRMSVEEVLNRAKALGVSLTSYLSASWMLAIHRGMPPRKHAQPITITLPVNLRNYYPSHTARNFFNNVYVTHIFDKEMALDELAKEFDVSLKSQLTEENIKQQMERFETMEYVAPVRAVPLFIKQLVVRSGSKMSDKKASMVFSNLGILKPPAKIADKIENYSTFCSSQSLFSTVSCYNGVLTFGVSSPYISTGAVKNFVRGFSYEGIDITVYATEVVGS